MERVQRDVRGMFLAGVGLLFGDDEFVAEVAVDVVGAVDEAVPGDLDIEGLVGGDFGHAEGGGFAGCLVVHFCTGDGDDVGGAIGWIFDPLVIAQGVGAEVGVVVALEGEVYVVFIEERGPFLAELCIIASRGGGVGGVVVGDEFPGGF